MFEAMRNFWIFLWIYYSLKKNEFVCLIVFLPNTLCFTLRNCCDISLIKILSMNFWLQNSNSMKIIHDPWVFAWNVLMKILSLSSTHDDNSWNAFQSFIPQSGDNLFFKLTSCFGKKSSETEQMKLISLISLYMDLLANIKNLY